MKNCGMEKRWERFDENSNRNLTYRINFDILMFSISRIFVVQMKRYKEISLISRRVSKLLFSFEIKIKNCDMEKCLKERFVYWWKFKSKSYVSNKCWYPYVFKNLRHPSEKIQRTIAYLSSLRISYFEIIFVRNKDKKNCGMEKCIYMKWYVYIINSKIKLNFIYLFIYPNS